MKKNKVSVYILGVMAALVWGMIIYKVVAALNEDEEMTTLASSAPVNKEPLNDYELIKDTATLKLNYRDPFQIDKPDKDTIQIPVAKLVSSNANVTNRTTSIKPIINWASVKYSGYVRSAQQKKLIAIISLNGQSLMLSEGESSGGIQLLKNLKDSVKVRYQNQTKFIAVNSGS